MFSSSSIIGKIREELANLSDSDRAQPAHFLIQSLDPGVDEEAQAGWNAELVSRGEDIKAGRAVGEPAERLRKGIGA